MQTAELVSLPLEARLLAMEALWDSLCRDPAAMQHVPSWHAAVLNDRLTALESGRDSTTPWDVAKNCIRAQAEIMSKTAP